MTDVSAIPSLSSEDLRSRYQLLCRATQPPDSGALVQEDLEKMQYLLQHDLLELARKGSPNNFADIYFALEQELERFREFCAFPALAQKTTIAFGGGFSAGKSSLINALLGQRLLATQIDPTTSVPTYLMHGASHTVSALNQYHNCIPLSPQEFLTLTHDELVRYGSSVGRLLNAAFVTHPDFPWPHLAFIDTPGYSKPDDENYSARTDAQLARIQLNTAHAIVWVVSAESGNITEDDLAFLATINRNIPRIVAVTRADKRTPHDVQRIVELVQQTLALRGMPAQAVIPVSARKKAEYPVEPLLQAIGQFDGQPREPDFARHFKRQFLRYSRYLEEAQCELNLHLNRLNRIVALVDDDDAAQDVQGLIDRAQQERTHLQAQTEGLKAFSGNWFMQLKKTGEKFSIALPEPSAVELLDLCEVNLLTMLRAERERQGAPEPDYAHILQALGASKPEPWRRDALLRHGATKSLLSLLSFANAATGPSPRLAQLLQYPRQQLPWQSA